jgi:hypothetical protein
MASIEARQTSLGKIFELEANREVHFIGIHTPLIREEAGKWADYRIRQEKSP